MQGITEALVAQNLLVIRQKGESQNYYYKKTKRAQFSEKWTFLTTWYAPVRVRVSVYEIFVFRKILRALFSYNNRFEIRLLPYYRQTDI